MANAGLDGNSRQTLTALSNANDGTIVVLWADPVTHRLLVNSAGGVTELTATGTVNGVNTAFTFTKLPSYIVADGAWYKQTDNNGNTQWSWNAGTLTATMTIPPTNAIFGIQ